MTLRLFNTLTKTKDVFAPIDAKNVRMYVCGPTVYDFAHIGNARPAIVFDILFRLLRHAYGDNHVTYVRNITDVDDKINERALRDFPELPLNEAIRNVTEKTEKQYHSDVDALGCLRPTFEPRATDFVLPRSDGKADMVTLIGQLIARGNAYEAGGEVLFDIQSMPDYGLLSGRKLDEQKAGARVAVDALKKHPYDFVLWKLSADNEPGWESPWGRGRPGWHIECSAMSAAYLGNMFDIHGGGLDLIFPHHENEIAQSRCAHNTPLMANIWMHNGFLQVEGEKMSKSAGNFFTIRELLADWPGEVLRFNMLQTHYRQPIDWTRDSLEQCSKRISRWRSFAADRVGSTLNTRAYNETLECLLDDLNTPKMFAALDHVVSKPSSGDSERFTVFKLLDFLGLREPRSAVANLDDKMKRARRKLQRQPPDTWHNIEAVAVTDIDFNKTATEFAANTAILSSCLSKIRDFVQPVMNQGNFSVPESQSSEVFLAHAVDFNFREGGKAFVNLEEFNESFSRLNKALLNVQENDWFKVVQELERPSSNWKKVEFDLIENALKLKELVKSIDHAFKPLLSAASVESLEAKYRGQARSEIQSEKWISDLVEKRNAARKAKNFAESDRIRDDLLAKGIVLKDGPQGTTWEVQK